MTNERSLLNFRPEELARNGLGSVEVPRLITRRSWLKRITGTFVGCSTAVGLYAWQVEPHWVEVVQREMAIANLPPSLVGCTIVQISDVHIGDHVDSNFLIEWFQRVAEWKPDIVVFTGDFMTLRSDRTIPVEKMEHVLSHFPVGKLATIGILGNHDYGVGWGENSVADTVVAIAEKNSMLDIIRNGTREICGLQIAGFDDYYSPKFDRKFITKNVDLDRPTLVLCHNPDVVDLPIWSGYRGWILSGHTHGGQCKAPYLTPPVLPLRNTRYSAGEIDLADGRRLYVNRALGHSMKVRFNVRPEITVFQLKNDEA